MTELKRWKHEGAPEAIERLLQAAESEQPSAASLASTLTSLGIAGGVTSVTSGAAASGAAAGGAASGAAVIQGKLSLLALTASFAKWIALGTVVSAAVVAVDAVTAEAPAPPSARPVVAQPPRSTATPTPPPAPAPSGLAGLGSASVPPAVAPTGARVRTEGAVRGAIPDAIPVETLAQEIAGIDRARSFLAAGRYSAATAALDDYERRFPRHHFTPEVLYLRMEAASGAGRTEEARRLARRLLAGYPTSPQSEKAKHLLDRKIE